MIAARSSRCLSSRSRNAKRIVVRCESDAPRHSRNAPAAVSTAASTSADGGKVDDAGLFSGGRVEHRSLLPGGARDCLAADPVADALQAAIVAFHGVGAGRGTCEMPPSSGQVPGSRSVDTTPVKVHNGAHRFRPRTLGVSHASHGPLSRRAEHRPARPDRRPCRVRWFEQSPRRRRAPPGRRSRQPSQQRFRLRSRRTRRCKSPPMPRMRRTSSSTPTRRPGGLGPRACEGRLRRHRRRVHDQQRHVLRHHPGAPGESIQVSDELLELHADHNPRGQGHRLHHLLPGRRGVARQGGWTNHLAVRPTCAATRWRSSPAPRRRPTPGDTWACMPGGMKIAGDTDHCTSAGKQDITVAELFDTRPQANAALLSGRADFGWADQPVADYQVKLESGQAEDRRYRLQRVALRRRDRQVDGPRTGRDGRHQVSDRQRLLHARS